MGNTSPLEKAIFLDRDGTLNEDPGYLNDPEGMNLLPGVGQALALLKQAGFVLVVVSNQSGVGRGLINEGQLLLIHERLGELLRPFGARIDYFQLCIHTPEDLCDCRKPKPKLILDAARSHGLDINASYMVGDKESDIVAGAAAGCKGSVLVLTGYGMKTLEQLNQNKIRPSFVGKSLLEVSKWILAQESEDS